MVNVVNMPYKQDALRLKLGGLVRNIETLHSVKGCFTTENK